MKSEYYGKCAEILISEGHGEYEQVKIHVVTQFPVIINGSQDKEVHQRQQEYIDTLKLNLQHPQVCESFFGKEISSSIIIILKL